MQTLLQIAYYGIITLLSLLLLYNACKKRPVWELICNAVVLVVFALRALHIK